MGDRHNDTRKLTRRAYAKFSGLALGTLSLGRLAGRGQASGGPIVSENNRPGDDGWQPTYVPKSREWRIDHRVEGYTSSTSVAPGETLELHVSTKPAARYRVDVYRLGWYDGAGGRIVESLPADRDGGQGFSQPIPVPDERGVVACDWEVTDTIEVTNEWTTGIYLARFTLESGEYAGQYTAHPFVVRPREDRARTPKAIVQVPDATSQAYNGWGGKSLYGFSSEGEAADAVSFDRPLQGPGVHINYAIHAARFLEHEGYDVGYVSDVDVHRNPELLKEYELAISAGHDEYWSRGQRLGFEEARDEGTNLAFLGANTAFWQVRYEDDDRIMVGYKEDADTEDPLRGTPQVTDLLRNVGLPECELLGVQGVGAGLYNCPDYTVQEAALDHPWMADTGFEAGDKIIGCIGHEWDRIRGPDCRPPGELTNFFHYEKGTSDRWIVNDQDADAVSYEAPSGATVFSTGTLGYTWRIDPDPSWESTIWPLSRVKEYKPEVLDPDPRLQQFTRNALDDLRKPN